MSQTIRTDRQAPSAVPQPRRPTWQPSPRQRREQDWKTLVGTYRLLSRLVVERTKHRFADSADTLARQAVLVEEELEHCYPTRWPRLHPQLLLEEAEWWAEEHDDEVISCTACRLQNGVAGDRLETLLPRRR
ncbi:hypothetical protein [Modestobacter roseus]|uniref:hypothetical protein n=1 Tax=Modestobacter roseus TaxID=1181884 RepID=UPI0012977F1B|nr:hypothetical protein [Modestobacter roseus]MQA35292.1 hypothetical protein [Modestobacter roseus]